VRHAVNELSWTLSSLVINSFPYNLKVLGSISYTTITLGGESNTRSKRSVGAAICYFEKVMTKSLLSHRFHCAEVITDYNAFSYSKENYTVTHKSGITLCEYVTPTSTFGRNSSKKPRKFVFVPLSQIYSQEKSRQMSKFDAHSHSVRTQGSSQIWWNALLKFPLEHSWPTLGVIHLLPNFIFRQQVAFWILLSAASLLRCIMS
jgi:hypothetical protein